MNRIYFDNAATTAIDDRVVDAMLPYLREKFGNPSSIYSYGRETKLAIENARKSVARILGAKPSEIFFTSGGTESSNMAINCAVRDLGCDMIISSPIEHHATLHATEEVSRCNDVELKLVKLGEHGHIDLEHLSQLLQAHKGKALVSLMHANNEIGNLLDIEKVAEICENNNAIFHCDTVQTVGHYPINLKDIKVHFITAASHKFHGPKGVGILYINEEVKIKPLIYGGAQERNMRAGTENTYGIVGFAKALELATESYEQDRAYIQSLKDYMIDEMLKTFTDISFNGDYKGRSLYTVLNVSFPENQKTKMLLLNLDIEGICVSSGSACSSGATTGSHVIGNLPNSEGRVAVRFSFCKHNTKEEIDTVIEQLKTMIN